MKGIPVKKVYLEPSAEECLCSRCNTPMEKIGTEFVRRELEIVPARARVIEYYSVNYGCNNCRRNAVTPNIIKGFWSADKNIATVTGKGKIKAVSKGKCTIYLMAENGVKTKVKVTVK